MVRSTLSIQTPGGTFRGCLCAPDAGRAPLPGLLFFHGSDGYGPQHGAVGERLARREQAAVLIPEWFGAGSPRGHWSELTWDDLEAFWGSLGERPEVARDRCGLIGFSRGGGVALAAASRLPDVRCVVDFFGVTSWAGKDGLRGLGLGASGAPEFVAGIKAPVLALHGEADDVVPVGDTWRLLEACARLGVACEAVTYPGVGHSFVWPGNPRFDPAAASDAWGRVHAFFARNLGA